MAITDTYVLQDEALQKHPENFCTHGRCCRSQKSPRGPPARWWQYHHAAAAADGDADGDDDARGVPIIIIIIIVVPMIRMMVSALQDDLGNPNTIHP